MPVLSQGRQSKYRADAPLQGPFYHPRVIRHGKNQIPVLSKTIGKYIDGAQIRQGFLQYPTVNEGVCITAGKQGPSSLPGFPVSMDILSDLPKQGSLRESPVNLRWSQHCLPVSLHIFSCISFLNLNLYNICSTVNL